MILLYTRYIRTGLIGKFDMRQETLIKARSL
jgi:hypothetical protein